MISLEAKILRAKAVHHGKKSKVFAIDDLNYIESMQPLKELLEDKELIFPIEVVKHEICENPRMGAGGKPYVEKKFSVHKGSQRIQAAIIMGYTHIEGVIINED